MNLTKPQKLIYDMEKFAGGSIALICGSMLMPGEANTNVVIKAVNELFRINTALRTRIVEDESGVHQEVVPYQEKEIEILRFKNKAELDSYAQSYAKEPLDFYGELCEAKIIILPEQYGVLVKLHHIIGDAWSLSLLGNQFNAILNGETPEAYSYADYVTAENDYLGSKRYEKDKSFFIEQFKKCDEVTYLNEKQSDSFNADRKTFIVDKEKIKEITDYTKKNNTSVFMLLTAVLSTYFSRVKMNAERFYIGTPVLNRGTAKEKNTVGMFINTVPMLIELSNDKSFAENLSGVEETAFSVLRHQRFNYGDILSEIRKEFNFTEKLYDVILSYQNATVAGNDIETTWYNSGMQSESLQIHIDDRDNEGILKIHYDYQTEKFAENEIEMIHAHLLNLLFNAIKNEDKKIYELEMLTEDEKQKLLIDFNDTAVDYPKEKCVHQLFEKQVEKTPDKVALIACDKTLTYKELNEEANRIAHSLIEKGIGVGDIIAFALPRKTYLIATMLGILKSGAAYLPIDPDYPKDRIEYMLDDSNSKLFITDDSITEFLSDKNISNPNVTMSSDNICYCIYTSGSTGKPKGVLLKHENVVNYVSNNKFNVVHSIIKETYKTIVSVTTVGFDIFVTESILPLTNGMTTVFADEKQSKIQSELNKLLLKYPADVLQTTPTKIKTLISDSTQLDYLKKFKVIILGGEALEKNLVDELKQLTNAEIFNIYGPTETTVWSTNKKITDKDITIGKPIANTQIYIVDKYMHPTPIGVTGELCIAGNGVGAGYLNRPELTAEKFIDNPFGEGRLYKTGDLAYWREDGNIMYVGRNDFQVKIRGLRIELGEIENAISSVDGIQQSVVVVRKNNEGRQLICAFYTGKEKEVSEIKKFIGTKLPKYMLPHIFTYIDEMPLTSSGKVNRKVLPEIDLENIESNVEYVAPVTEKEIALVSAVQSVLGAEKIGILDNFFDIGGDSLKAIELISKLEAKGFTTDTKTIFDCENIKELAQKITEKKSAKEKANYGNVVAATPAQLRVYTAQNMNSDSTLYNIPYVFRTENLDCNRLETAINKLISRHESLRTHFENRNGEIVQVIDRQANITVQQLETDDILSFVKPFDLSKSPLLRVGCFENTVMIDMHHIISDGGTMPVFFKELNELYMGREIINEPVQYGEFAVAPVDNTENENYWLSVFNDEIPVLEINTDYPRTDKQSFNGAAVYDSVSIETHKKITEKCKVLGITPYVFYMAAFNIMLSKYSGNEDVIVGMPVSGRTPKYLNTIGMFVNTVALRNKPDGNKTVEEFLNKVKETSIEAISHQNYPFGTLVKKLGIEPNGRNPLFDVMFAYQSEQMTDVIFGDKKAELLPIPVTTSKSDFTFNIMPRNDDVVIMAEYCTDLYREQTIHHMIEAYKSLICQIIHKES